MAACALLASLSMNSFASPPPPVPLKGKFWEHGIGYAIKQVDDLLLKWESDGIDTSYIQVPEYDRMFYFGSYGFSQQHKMHYPVAGTSRYFDANVKSTQMEMDLGIDWRGLAIELPIQLFSLYNRSYGLAKNGSVWGARFRYKKVGKASDRSSINNQLAPTTGVVTPSSSSNPSYYLPFYDKDENMVPTDKLDLKTIYLEGYYVFNHSRFSLAASLFGDMIQKKSAGGFFVMGNFMQTKLGVNRLLLHNREVFTNGKISLGAGYGYNLALLNGNLCLHASIIPMVSLYNHISHESWDDASYKPTLNDNETHFYEAITMHPNSNITLNAFGRLAISYCLSKHFLLNGYVNYRQYHFSNSADLRIVNRDADFQMNLGYRF